MLLTYYRCVILILIKLHWCDTKYVLLNNSESEVIDNDITNNDEKSNSELREILQNIFYEECVFQNNNNLNPLLLKFYCQIFLHDILKSVTPDEHKKRKRRGLLGGYSYSKPPIDESIESDTPPPASEESVEETYPYPPPIDSRKVVEAPLHVSVDIDASKAQSSYEIPPPASEESIEATYPYPPSIDSPKEIDAPLHVSIDTSKERSSFEPPSSLITEIHEANNFKVSKELLDIAEKHISESELSEKGADHDSTIHVHDIAIGITPPKITEVSDYHPDHHEKSDKETRNAESDITISSKKNPPATSYGVPDSNIKKLLKQSSNALKRFPNTTRASDAKPNNLINSSYGVPLSSVIDLPNDEDSKATRAITGDSSNGSTEYPPFVVHSPKNVRDTSKQNNAPPATSYGIPDTSIVGALEQSSNALKHYPNATRASDAKPNDLIKSSYGAPLSSVKDLPKIDNFASSETISIPEKDIKTKFTRQNSNNFPKAIDNANFESSIHPVSIEKSISSDYELVSNENLVKD